MNSKDEIFQQGDYPNPFAFTKEVAEVFDDMAQRSIPAYEFVQELICSLVERFDEEKECHILDLGASVGALEKRLAERFPERNLNAHLVDNSQAMLEEARKKLAPYLNDKSFFYSCSDISGFRFTQSAYNLTVLNYTLQFCPETARKTLLKQIHKTLKRGGYLFLSEKVVLQDNFMQDFLNTEYYRFKKNNSYTELEIARKKQALEDVLLSWTKEKLESSLRTAGFRQIEILNQSFQFTTWLCRK